MKKFRKEYKLGAVKINKPKKNPYIHFSAWFSEAVKACKIEPNAFCLSTAGKNGRPSSRIILLKKYSKDGFIFFTNYESNKGKELTNNPFASMLFYWPELERQVSIKGKISKVKTHISDKYFSSRPFEAQVAAIVSGQSSEIRSKKDLLKKWQAGILKYHNKKIKRPGNWGGYILVPDYFEFWQGRENRLHDRIAYCKFKGKWDAKLLSP